MNQVDGILLLYAHSVTGDATTIMEHVNAFERYSQYRVFKVHTDIGFPRTLLNYSFRTIILHYSLFGSLPFKLNKQYIDYLKTATDSYKIAFFQDEMHYGPDRFAHINQLGVNCIYSLLDPNYFDEIYLQNTNAQQVLHTLTGYVDDSLVEKARQLTKPFSERTIDVGYRARDLPYYLGKGAQEKTEIAQKFIAHAKPLGLKLDIKTAEGDRIYGEAWTRFIANCKAVIGVEAGVSIFDIEDKVRPAVEALLVENPNISFDEVHERVLAKWEDKMHYRTISPRVFEAAALRTCQILYEGPYQGILEPMVHYIPLKKDFSNFDEVMALFRDTEFVKKITDRAYADLIASKRYSYQQFIQGVDEYLSPLAMETSHSTEALATMEKLESRLATEQGLQLIWARIKHRVWHGKWPGKPLVKAALQRVGFFKR